MLRFKGHQLRVFVRYKSYTPKIHWYYATDHPISKPNEPNYKPEPPTKFMPFSNMDSKRLEHLYQIKPEGKVPVNEDHLFEVDMESRSMQPVYWSGPVYEVRRGLWFHDGMPISEQLSDEVEKMYATSEKKEVRKLASSKGEFIKFADEHTAYIIPELIGGKLQLDLINSVNVPVGKKLVRGHQFVDSTTPIVKSVGLHSLADMIDLEFTSAFGLPSLQEQESSEIQSDYDNKSNFREVDHLVFCVHGIGQTLGSKYQYVNFAHTVNLLRNNMKSIDPETKVQVLPISWRGHIGFNTNELVSQDATLPTLNDITVGGLKTLRKALGDVVLDVLLYYDPHYLHQILSATCKELNLAYEKFTSRNSSFEGKVSIVGHSLGSVIIYEILCRQKDHSPYRLNFDVKNFFAIGSPVGVFNLIKRKNMEVPSSENMFNVYHLCDPVAYRMEPLIDKATSRYQEENVPDTSSAIVGKMADLTSLVSETEKTETIAMPARQLRNLLRYNRNGRVDYSLPMSLFESDIISALKAHVSYFEDKNVANFILKNLELKPPVTSKTVKQLVSKPQE